MKKHSRNRAYIIFLTCIFLIGCLQVGNCQMSTVKEIEQLIQKCDSLYEIDDNIELELSWLSKAEELTDQIQGKSYDTLIIKVKKYLGFIYMDTDVNERAIDYFKQVLALSQKNELSEETIEAMMYIGQGYGKQLNMDEAMAYLESSLNLLEAHHHANEEELKTNIWVNIGLVYLELDLTEEAIALFQKALELATRNDDIENQLVIYNNLSICESNRGRYDEAIALLKKGIEISLENDLGEFYEPYDNIGTNYVDLMQFDSAYHYYNKAKTIAIRTNDEHALAGIYSSLGWAYSEQGDFQKGISHLKKSRAYADSLQNIELVLETDLLLGEAYEKIEDYRQALTSYHKVLDTKLKINSNLAERKAEEFNVKYKTLEQEKELALLKQDKAYKETIIARERLTKKVLWTGFLILLALMGLALYIRSNANKKRIREEARTLRLRSIIMAEQKERKRIAQDVHDSLGQSISVLKIQAQGIPPDSIDQPSYSALLSDIDTIYDQLREVSHKIMPSTLVTLGLIPALRELIDEMENKNPSKIELSSTIEGDGLNEEKSISLYRIIKETLGYLVDRTKSKLIHISFDKQGENPSVIIKEQGKKSNRQLGKLFKEPEWQSIESKVGLLQGTITTEKNQNSNTLIRIQLLGTNS